MAVPAWSTAACAKLLDRGHHLHHPQPRGGRLVDVVARLPAQLRLIGVQVAEQDAGLPLADVQAGELLQTLRVIAPVTDRDVQPELARVGAVGCSDSSSTAKPSSLRRRMVPSTR